MVKLPKDIRPSPMTIRSRVVLEIASELVAMNDHPEGQAKVLLKNTNGEGWPLALWGSSTALGVEEVVSGETTLAIINPSAALSLAYKGTGPFSEPQPVRVIATIPSRDSCMFAVAAETGLTHIEQIAEQKVPLRLMLRGQPDHWLQNMLDHIAAAAGFSLQDIVKWGGSYRREGHIPHAGEEKFQAMARGEINAIFDESITNWCNEATPAGMTVLNMRDETLARLEAMGYRRDVLRKADFPTLPHDIQTLNFSGWPIFVREDADDDLVTRICRGLNARRELIPWQEPGPLPVERMARDNPDTPLDVPLHPAAERFWRECGYLD